MIQSFFSDSDNTNMSDLSKFWQQKTVRDIKSKVTYFQLFVHLSNAPKQKLLRYTLENGKCQVIKMSI